MTVSNPATFVKNNETFQECINKETTLTANIPLELLPDNPKRAYAAFVNISNSDITVVLGNKSSAVIRKGIVLKCNGGSFEINNLNLYTGKVTAIAEANCQLSYVECSK